MFHASVLNNNTSDVQLTWVPLAESKVPVKILNIRTPQKFAAITLKFYQDGFTKE